MHLLASILTEVEAKQPLIMPPVAFALIAITVFVVLGLATWTYRDVAHRHSDKFPGGANDDTHHGAGH